jgi:nicotinamide-nucleotide amidase
MKKSDINAEIISVGTEILLGHIINTNASYLSRKLSEIGINLFYQSVVGDNPARLNAALKNALERSDIVITGGGLGPTVDDITIATISEVVSQPLVLNKDIEKSIEIYFKKRHIKMPPYVMRQAYVPKAALAIENPVGTAPGVIIDYRGKVVIALPGPPSELIPIFEDAVIPYLKKKYETHSIIFTRTIRTAEIPESAINKKIKNFLMMKTPLTVGIYARPNEVDVKITAKAENKKKALADIERIEKKISHILGDCVYGFDNDTLEEVVGKELIRKRMSLSIAESCTGGLISNRITNISGSSKYFDNGIVTYSNESKIRDLGVDKKLIERYGAVSRPVAIAMAKGMLKKSGSDVALAVTGIAGPTGGTKNKPVGLVYIALAHMKKTHCIECHFVGNRADIKHQTATAALDLLRKALCSKI